MTGDGEKIPAISGDSGDGLRQWVYHSIGTLWLPVTRLPKNPVTSSQAWWLSKKCLVFHFRHSWYCISIDLFYWHLHSQHKLLLWSSKFQVLGIQSEESQAKLYTFHDKIIVSINRRDLFWFVETSGCWKKGWEILGCCCIPWSRGRKEPLEKDRRCLEYSHSPWNIPKIASAVVVSYVSSSTSTRVSGSFWADRGRWDSWQVIQVATIATMATTVTITTIAMATITAMTATLRCEAGGKPFLATMKCGNGLRPLLKYIINYSYHGHFVWINVFHSEKYQFVQKTWFMPYDLEWTVMKIP